MVLIDTNIIIDFLKGKSQALDFFGRLDEKFSTSVITVAELYAGVKGSKEEEILESFLELFEILPLTNAIATLGGKFRNKYGPKFGMGLADALIAATAIHHKAGLITLNKRHFQMLDNVNIPYKSA